MHDLLYYGFTGVPPAYSCSAMYAGSTGAKKGSLGPRVPSKMPMVRHTNNHWYRARVLREDTKRVQIGELCCCQGPYRCVCQLCVSVRQGP